MTVTNNLPAVIDHSQRAHAVLSASGCKRWWNCPGSVQASEGIPNTSSEWAELGTAAHELANECLEQRLDAATFIGAIFNGMEVTEAMADAVQVYLDTCGLYMDAPWEYYVERRFSLEKLGPPVPMFGTSDFTALNRELRRLVVVDYKNGAGVDVSIAGNAQLRYYALGALYSFDDMPEVEEVEIIIVQPNTPGLDVKRETFHIADLIEWSVTLIDKARATQEPNAPLKAGEWCKFCPREGRCVEQARNALAAAQIEFESFVEPLPSTNIIFPDLTLITAEQFGALIPRLDDFEAWSKAARKTALDMAERGISIPGQKVVPTRATERWLDTEIAPVLLEDLGLKEDAIYEPRKLVSPAQARGAIATAIKTASDALPGKKMTKKAAEEKAKEFMKPMTHKVSSGNKLAPDHDSRTAVMASVHSEFSVEDGPVIDGVAVEFELEIG